MPQTIDTSAPDMPLPTAGRTRPALLMISLLMTALLVGLLPSGHASAGESPGLPPLALDLGVNSLSEAQQAPLESGSNFSLAPAFLPVEEAYRLSGQLTNDSKLQLEWQIADGYYLYRHQLKVSIDGSDHTPELPAGQTQYDDYFERELQVYYQSLALELPVPQQPRPLDIRVESQGCADAGLCYPPQQQTLRLENGEVTLLDTSAPAPNAGPAGEIATGLSPAKLALAALGALLGGLLLNLMPCVFPVLSLKALSLAGGQQQPQRQRRHGWAYTGGAVTTFVGIAAIMLLLRHSGQWIGWGFQLQSPLLVALLVYLFFIMGLSLSGVFNLGGWLSGSGQSLTEGHSYRASFFTGALAGVVASPCTAPFMGSALGFAVTQPAPVALTIFAALGLGMALPFLLLSYFPGLSDLLPRPGQWMETLKQLLAFPLYLTALWLLWVVGRQQGNGSIIALLCGAVAITFAVWLWQHRPQRNWQKVLAALALLGALWPLTTLDTQARAPAAGSEVLSHQWQPFTQQRLDTLLAANTPTFVNLTADWCLTCLANERVALDTERTLAAFEETGVVKLKGDWTHYNPEITRLLSRFGRNGVPLYLFYSGEPGAQPQILPQLLREQQVIDLLQTAQNHPNTD